MPRYRYKARDREGELHTGTLDAENREGVADQVSVLGLIPVLIEEQEEGPLRPEEILHWIRRVPPRDLIIFSRQLATLGGAGIPLLQSLASIEQQTANKHLREALSEIRRDVEADGTFADALAKHPRIFRPLYVSMVRAGETAGLLDEVLERLALLAEHDLENRERVSSAVRYPAIVLVTLFAAFAFLAGFVIPRFTSVFERFRADLPVPTRVMIGISQLVHSHGYVLLAAAAAAAAVLFWLLRTPRGRWQWDRLKLRLPLFGDLFLKSAMSRFARIFSSLQKSGVPLLLTIEIASETVGNAAVGRALRSLREDIREGRGLAGPLERAGLFPPLLVQMMAAGEETGELDELLARVSDLYDRDVHYALRNLSAVVEPVLLLVVGSMVLFLALAIFLPMWDMITLFRK